MSDEIQFTLDEVDKIPSRRYRKGSKYDAVLDQFIESKTKLVKVEIPGKEANYIRTQIAKRLVAREDIKNIKTSVINDVCYLEIVDTLPLVDTSQNEDKPTRKKRARSSPESEP
jgi:hypothetical protein